MNIHSFSDFSQNNQENYPHYSTQMQGNQRIGMFDRSIYKWKSFTFGLILLLVVLFFSELAYFYFIIKGPSYLWNCALYNFGGKFTPAIVHDFQIWREFTAIFLHSSLYHITSNSLSICAMMFYLENEIGPKKMLFIFLLTGIYGNILSTDLDKQNIGVGASGGIMGISGFLLLLFFFTFHRMNDKEKQSFFIFLIFTIANLTSTKVGKDKNKVDIYAHLGGFFSGAFASIFILADKIDTTMYSKNLIKRMKIGFGAILAIFPFVSIIYLANTKLSQNFLKTNC